MAIYLYRYLRKKWDARTEGPSTSPTLASAEIPPSCGPQADIEQEQAATNVAPSDKPTIMWRILLLLALAVPVFLETLDYTVVATAQVHIASVFNRLDLQSYIGTIYLLTSTVFLPPFASLADIFGRHWALQLALFFFMVGSAISTGAQNMAMMLAGRGVAGIGAAGLLAVVRIILTDSRSLDANNWQQTMLFLLYVIGYCLGPFIGGELLTVSFRWIFAINLPCCAVGIVVAFLILRGRTKGSQSSQKLPTAGSEVPRETFFDKLFRIDWIGAALFMGGGVCILLALNWGSVGDWDSAKVIACFIVGGVSIILFFLWQYYLERVELVNMTSKMRLIYTDPMIPLELFKSLDVCIVMYGTLVSGMVMLVMFYFVAIFFVIVSNLSATQSGVQLIYFAPGMGGGSLISIQLVRFLRQPKIPIVIGGVISTVALGLISYGMNKNDQGLVNGFMAMAGVGTGLLIGPLAIQGRFTQPEERNAVVSGLLLFFRALGGTIGLAQCGAVLNAKVKSYISNLVATGAITASEAASITISSSTGLSSVNGLDSLSPNVQQFVRDAFRQGSRYAFISLVPWAALGFITSLFLSRIHDSDAQMAQARAEEHDVRVDRADQEKEVGNASPKTDAGYNYTPPFKTNAPF